MCISDRYDLDYPTKVIHPTKTHSDIDTMLSLIHISEPTRLALISYAVFCLKNPRDF
ncbi:hypothetical protein JMUB7540_28040 [Staphylococcus aureus]